MSAHEFSLVLHWIGIAIASFGIAFSIRGIWRFPNSRSTFVACALLNVTTLLINVAGLIS